MANQATLRVENEEPGERASSRIGPLWSVALLLGLGLIWLGEEALLQAAVRPTALLPELGRRTLDALPVHLLLFAGFGTAAGALAMLRPMSARAVAWMGLGFVTFCFLGLRVLEGLRREYSLAMAGVGALGLAIGLVLVLYLAWWVGERLGPRAESAWFWAVWTAWSMIFVLFMQHAGWEIGRWEGTLLGWIGYLEFREVAMVLFASTAVFLARSSLPPLWARGGAALGLIVVCFSILAGASPPEHQSRVENAPDVMVILIDTLRFDHVGLERDGSSVTPSLDALARESVRFKRSYSPSNWTRASMPGIMASLPEQVTGYLLPEEVETLAEHFQRAGWATYGFSANPWITKHLGYGQGFDEFTDIDSTGAFLITNLMQIIGAFAPRYGYQTGAVNASLYYPTAAEIRSRVANFLERSPGPSMVYLQIMDAHGPYMPPKEFLPEGFDYSELVSYYRFMSLAGKQVLTHDDFHPQLENLRTRYAAGVRYADSELGKLFDVLRRQGRYDEMLIWVISDHGEAFGENDQAGHSGEFINESLIHTPMIMKPPASWEIPARDETLPVSGYSLLPTTLALMGLPPAKIAFGEDHSALVRSLPGTHEGRSVIAHAKNLYTAIRWPFKLRLRQTQSEAVSRTLFDLSLDPDESRDIADEHAELVRELEKDINAWRERIRVAKLNRDKVEIDAATAARLKMLGYIDDDETDP